MAAHKDMAVLVEKYIDFRRKLDFDPRNERNALLGLVRYAGRTGHQGPITVELAVQWATLPRGVDFNCHVRRFGIARRFARYWAMHDPRVEVPPEGLLGASVYRRPTPYIYSKEEISLLLRAAAGLYPHCGLRPNTYVTLFGLLACTGLRISEALRLTRKDVDMAGGVLTVVDSKFHKSRLVPIHSSTVMALSFYAEHRDCYHPSTQSKTFFLDERGSPLKQSSVLKTFERMRERLGWKRSEGHSPKIHSLRHTFAVRRLLAWYKQGVDLERKMAALSTYMGHANVRDTYWYLSAVPELLDIVGHRFERFVNQDAGEKP
jgi:integrase